MLSVAAFALLLPFVASYDLAVGLNSYGTKIFDEDRQASPAIWKQKENVTVEAPDNEVIVKVLVIDMRPEKDGDATIVDGGENQKYVTIELKSPTALRGYNFHIEVYAAPAESSSDTASTETSETNLPTDDSSTRVKCPKEGTVVTEETILSQSADTVRETRNLVMENDHESNDTDINTDDQTDAINEKVTTESELTTLSDISTTTMPDEQSTISNLPDFPLTGMEGDETRHVRKIGDDLFTSTVHSLYPTFNVDSTTTPNSFNDYDTSTVSDISTTQQSDDSFTVPPNTSNGKDIPDFDDLLSTDGEESRIVRHVSSDFDGSSEEESNDGIDTTTSSEFSTTVSGETTTLVPEYFSDSGNEARNSRDAVYDTTNESTGTQTNGDGVQVPPLFQIMTGNGDYNSSPTTVETDEEENVTESSGDFTTDVYDTTILPDAATTPVTSISFAEEQLRMARGIIEDNGGLTPATSNGSDSTNPLFIDPAILGRANASDDYVYVPILAVISKQSYPAFRGALDNISMNVAFPNNNLDTNTAVEQQVSFGIPNTAMEQQVNFAMPENQ